MNESDNKKREFQTSKKVRFSEFEVVLENESHQKYNDQQSKSSD